MYQVLNLGVRNLILETTEWEITVQPCARNFLIHVPSTLGFCARLNDMIKSSHFKSTNLAYEGFEARLVMWRAFKGQFFGLLCYLNKGVICMA